MRRVLFLLPSWTSGSAASQIALAASLLPADRFYLGMAALGPEGPQAAHVRESAGEVVSLGWRHWSDATPWRRLIRFISSFAPDVTVAAGLPASRSVALVPQRLVGRVLAMDLPPFPEAPAPRALDRWALARAARIIVSGPAEHDAALRFGLAAKRLLVLAPGIERAEELAAPAPNSFPENQRIILAVGPLERDKGLQDAIWAFEMLRYLFDDLRLAIVGEGPDRERLMEFARAIEATGAVQFLGYRQDLSTLYARATVIWIPSKTDRGVRVALEAMRMGKPIVASRWPRLAEVLAGGGAGRLVQAGDKVDLARQTRQLLEDPELAARIGNAGRERALAAYSAEAFRDGLAALLE